MRVFVFFLLMTFYSSGQSYFKDHFGAQVGILFTVGSHINQVGVRAQAYYSDYFYQLNVGTTISLNQRNLGGRFNFLESRNSLGLVLLGGKRTTLPNYIQDGLNHQTSYNLGVAYNYLWYFDNRGTSQRSGGFGLHIHHFSLYHENDVFAGDGRDRFRTGHVYANYRYNDLQFGVGVQLWTGETRGADWQKIKMDKNVHGFKLLEDLPYGRTSHGIIYGTIAHQLPYSQYAQLRFGVDSEHIRHGFQNRLIHDVLFLPKGVIKKVTPHYPRLDEYGCPTFEKSGARNEKAFIQLGLNENWAN